MTVVERHSALRRARGFAGHDHDDIVRRLRGPRTAASAACTSVMYHSSSGRTVAAVTGRPHRVLRLLLHDLLVAQSVEDEYEAALHTAE